MKSFLKSATRITNFDHQFDKVSGILFLFFGKNEGITFSDEEIPSILGFKGMREGSGVHIGYKMLSPFQNFFYW